MNIKFSTKAHSDFTIAEQYLKVIKSAVHFVK